MDAREPEGLRPIARPPQGVAVRSSATDLVVEIDWSKREDGQTLSEEGATSSSLPQRFEFYVLYPADAPIEPELRAYLLARSETTAPDASESLDPEAPGILSEQDAEKEPALSAVAKAENLITVEEEGVVRFWRLLRLSVHPRPVRVSDKGYYAYRSATIRFAFSQVVEPPGALAEYEENEKGFGRILRSVVSNPEAMALYASREQGADNTPSESAQPWSPQRLAPEGKWLRLTVDTDDVYRLTHNQIEAAGFQASTIDPANVRLYSRGRQVPTLLTGPESRRFTADTNLVFYGQGSRSAYSTERAYWAWLDAPAASAPEGPLRMERRDFPQPPARLTSRTVTTRNEYVVEEDNALKIEHGNFLSIKNKAWVWADLAADRPFSTQFDLPRPNLESETDVEFEIAFFFHDLPASRQPFPGVAPQLVVELNDAPQIELDRFTHVDDTVRRFSAPASRLREAGNRIALRFKDPPPRAQDQATIYLDNIRIRYDRDLIPSDARLEVATRGEAPWHLTAGFLDATPPYVFDLTDATTPTYGVALAIRQPLHLFYEPRPKRSLLAVAPEAIAEASGAEPLLRPDPGEHLLSDPANEADYLIVYHHLYKEALEPLAQMRRAQGLRVGAVDVRRVYQEYSAGELTPLAIKAFLTDAVRHWRTPPTYVLLFGDATSDYRGELRAGLENQVPAYTYVTHGEEDWASELWYATLVGEDLLPDIALGRLPARNVEDARQMVRKTVDYATSPTLGPWRGRFAYFSDDSETGGFQFHENTDELFHNYQPRAYANERLYLEDHAFEDNFYLPRSIVQSGDKKVSTAATLALLQTLNRGAAVMIYVGHGSPNLWATERVWFGGDTPRSDNLNLRNGPRLPFLASFTCNQGAFDYPMQPWHINISEDMLRTQTGGTIAMYLPAGPGVANMHAKMAQDLFAALGRENVRRVGDAVALSRIYSILQRGLTEMVRMSVLLGDPALDLALPERTGKAGVEPPVVSTADPTPRVTFRAETPGLSAGRFSASLYGPDERLVRLWPPQAFSGGAIHWSFEAPQPAVEGEWTVRVYYGDDASKIDGQCWAPLRVERPLVRVESLQCTSNPREGGGAARLELRVANVSDVEARAVPIWIGPPDAASDPDLRRVERLWDFAPRETRTLECSYTLASTATLHAIVARAESCVFPADPSLDARAEMRQALWTGANGGPPEAVIREEKPLPDLRIKVDSVRFTPQEPTEGDTIFIRGIVENAGKAMAGAFRLGATAGRPDQKALRVQSKPHLEQFLQPPLAPGRERPFVLRWDHQAFETHAGANTVTITVDEARQVEEAHEANNASDFELRIKSRPEILEQGAFVEKYERLPDGQIEVAVKIRIKNQGEGVARNYCVGFYNQNPETPEQYLDPGFLAKEVDLGPIEGGEEREVEETWRMSAGDRATSPTAKFYRNLETIRLELENKPGEKPKEW